MNKVDFIGEAQDFYEVLEQRNKEDLQVLTKLIYLKGHFLNNDLMINHQLYGEDRGHKQIDDVNDAFDQQIDSLAKSIAANTQWSDLIKWNGKNFFIKNEEYTIYVYPFGYCGINIYNASQNIEDIFLKKTC